MIPSDLTSVQRESFIKSEANQNCCGVYVSHKIVLKEFEFKVQADYFFERFIEEQVVIMQQKLICNLNST